MDKVKNSNTVRGLSEKVTLLARLLLLRIMTIVSCPWKVIIFYT